MEQAFDELGLDFEVNQLQNELEERRRQLRAMQERNADLANEAGKDIPSLL